VDDVQWAPLHQLVALRVVDDVVRRRHEPLERAGDIRVVTHGPERLHDRHSGERTIRFRP
jgi:hypothetical protein